MYRILLIAAAITWTVLPDRAIAAPIVLNTTELQNVNNLSQIALAMYNYDSAMGRLPPLYVANGGTPVLSWRVLLLPYLGEQDLYDQFDLTKAWDDPVNVPLLDQMPEIFRSPFDPSGVNTTRYVVGAGLNSVFEGATGVRLTDITDGVSNTLLVGESGVGIPWTKPEDIPIDPAPVFGPGGFWSFTSGVVPFVIADGSVRFLPTSVDSQTLRGLFLRNDGTGDLSMAIDYTAVPEPRSLTTVFSGGILFALLWSRSAGRWKNRDWPR